MSYLSDAKPRKVPAAGFRYVKAFRDRRGMVRYYYRRRGSPATPLTGDPGSEEFRQAYERAAGLVVRGVTRPKLATIYFVQIRGFDLVKIGYGADPDRRLSQIEHGAGMPGALVTLHRMPGYRGTERGLHKRFADARLFGEWFRLSGPVADWLTTVQREAA